MHILIRSGHITLKKKSKSTSRTPSFSQNRHNVNCIHCSRIVEWSDRAECPNSECRLDCHLICLSERFLEPNEYVPIIGSCPKCRQMMLWADVVRKLKGHVDVQIDSD